MPASRTELLPPGTDYNAFLGLTEAVKTRPIDHLALSISYKEACDLAAAGNLAANIIEKETPDIVFFPQRGAGPIEWTVEEMLNQHNAQVPEFVDLPLGTHTDVIEGNKAGLRNGQKTQIIKETLASLKEEGIYNPGKSRIMIIDEVQKGGTLSQATLSLKTAMAEQGDESDVSVIAMQDSREAQHGETRTESFKKLAANEWPGFKTYVIPVTLFTVDVSKYLDIVASDMRADEIDSLASKFQTVQNTEARALFQALARTYCSPEQGLQELGMVKQEAVVEDLGNAALQYSVVDAITDPRQVENRASTQQIDRWWTLYIQRIQSTKATAQE